MPEFFERAKESFEEHSCANSPQKCQKILNKINGIKKSLSVDEIIYIDYKRQTECHIIQDSFKIRYGKQNGFIFERNNGVLGKCISVYKVEGVVSTITENSRGKKLFELENKFATQIAEKIQKYVEPLLNDILTTILV